MINPSIGLYQVCIKHVTLFENVTFLRYSPLNVRYLN